MKSLPFILICLFLFGCVSPQQPAQQPVQQPAQPTAADDHDNIAEAVFRYMCQPEPDEKDVSSNVNRDEVSFLSFSNATDPSPEFLRRFSDLQIPVKPISAGEWRGTLIYDKMSGEGGAAFYIEKISMLSRDEAEVEAVVHPGGGLSASGLIYHVSRKGGKWTVTSEKLKWIS